MLRKIAALLLIASTPAETALAQQKNAKAIHTVFITGNDLWEMCQEKPGAGFKAPDYAQCRGYIVGVSDTYLRIMAELGYPSCLKAGVTIGQLADVVIMRLKDHPEYRHVEASNEIVVAIKPLVEICN